MDGAFEPGERGPSQVVYDRVSGRLLATYRRLDVESGELVPGDEAEALHLVRADESLVGEAIEGAADLATIAVHSEPPPAAPVRVAPQRGGVVASPRLRLVAERDEIAGNGEDSLEISIDVIDESEQRVGDYRGPLHVSTTRGRLSARGGDLELAEGRARLTLTSVPETVDEVIVRATTPDGSLLPGALAVRFL